MSNPTPGDGRIRLKLQQPLETILEARNELQEIRHMSRSKQAQETRRDLESAKQRLQYGIETGYHSLSWNRKNIPSWDNLESYNYHRGEMVKGLDAIRTWEDATETITEKKSELDSTRVEKTVPIVFDWPILRDTSESIMVAADEIGLMPQTPDTRPKSEY